MGKKSLCFFSILILLGITTVRVAAKTNENVATSPAVFRQNQEAGQIVRSQVAQRHAARLSYRFAIYNLRLTSIVDRMQTRLDILAADDKDTTAAQVKLTEAKAALTKAKTKAEAAINTFNSIDPDKYAQQRDLALQARDIAQESREDWQAVINLLGEVLQLIKAL